MPYAVAQGTVELPYVFVQCVLYSVITYFLINLQLSAGARPWLAKHLTCVHPVRALKALFCDGCSFIAGAAMRQQRCSCACLPQAPGQQLIVSCPQSSITLYTASVFAVKFWWYFLFLFLTLLYYTYYGLCAIVISPSLQVCAQRQPQIEHACAGQRSHLQQAPASVAAIFLL